MKFGWKVLIPFSLAWIMVVSTLRVMSQQQAPKVLIIAFIFSIVLIYLSVTTLVDREKAKVIKAAKVTDSAEPDFPVPAIPNSRSEQLNG